MSGFHSQPASFTDKEVEATRARRDCTQMLRKALKKKSPVFCSSPLELGSISTLKEEHHNEKKGFSQWTLCFLLFKPGRSHCQVLLRSGAQGHCDAQRRHAAYAAPHTDREPQASQASSDKSNWSTRETDRWIASSPARLYLQTLWSLY